MRVRFLETPELTGKVWDNELAGKTDFREGHDHSQIMDNINVGDIHILGNGEKCICVFAHKKVERDTHPCFAGIDVGNNWLVSVHPTKKDGTVHRGLASYEWVHDGYSGWDRLKDYK